MARQDSSVDGPLKPIIRKALVEDRARPYLRADGKTVADGGMLRVSSLAGVCAREEVLCSRLKIERPDTIGADLMMIFEHGNGLHWDLQNRVLVKTRSILGRWLCGCCGTYVGGLDAWDVPVPKDFKESQLPRPAVCPKCETLIDSDNSLYQEQFLTVPEFRLCGHPDGFLRVEGLAGLGVLEAKSINPKGAWEVRGCPKLDHVVQAQCYMWMTGCRWGKIVYWDKAGSGMASLIEHTIDYDDDQVEAIQCMVSDIWKGVEEPDTPLPDRICAHPDAKRAELCAVAKPCFEEVA
jgi:hypothetical protein